MQLQLQFIIHFLPVPSGFHFHTHAFRSLLRVFCALRTVHVMPMMSHQHGIKRSSGVSGTSSHLLCTNRHSLQTKYVEKVGKLNIVGPYIPYDLLQTKGETCAKFGSDWFRNVDLYKFHTNKQTVIFMYKITSRSTQCCPG